MIESNTFGARMALLGERFLGKKLSQPVLLEYLEHLDEKLSTEEFVQASKLIFARDTYLPSPQRFLDVLAGDSEAQALEVWAAIMARMAAGEAYLTLEGSRERKLLNAATNGRASDVKTMDFMALERVEKKFVKLWLHEDDKKALESVRPVRALPTSAQVTQVLERVGASVRDEGTRSIRGVS